MGGLILIAVVLALGYGVWRFGVRSPTHSSTTPEAPDAWVTSDRLNRRTCPSETCGIVGTHFFREGVTVYERVDGWARITRPYDASCWQGKSEYVDSGNDACTSKNGIVDGRFAEWVSLAYLSSERPTDPAAGATGDAALVAGSDDYRIYGDAFTKAATQLILSGTCSRRDFEESGGWLKSTLHGEGSVYFTYCGGYTTANRLYLNAATGEVSR